ncbi:MAG: AraC family transcriptional regulator [Treponema sp.]|jgi:AraC-like DNA-binding protein|nr:AraC family transcriptional regulator [Treponema sp.]
MKQQTSRVFITWVLSYILIMLIPIAIGFFAYYEAVDAISSETEALHLAASRQLRQLLDENLNELSRVSNEIAYYSPIQNYMNYHVPLEPIQEYVKKDIQIYINWLYTFNSFLSGIYIYFARTNLFVGTSTVYREDEFEYMSETHFGLSYGELKNFINERRYTGYKIVSAHGGVKKILTRRKVYSENYSSDAEVLFVVNAQKLEGIMMNAVRHPRERVFILDDSGGVFSPGETFTLPSALSYDTLLGRPELFRETLDGEINIVFQSPSSVNPWRYVMLIPEEIYFTKVKYIKTTIYLYIVFCLLLGFFLSVYFAGKNYHPVKKLTRYFEPSPNRDALPEKNEFYFLENSIKKLLNIKQLTEEKLRRQDIELRRSYIAALLTGEKGVDKKALALAGLDFKGADFIVIVFKLKNVSKRMMKPGSDNREEAAELSRFVVNQAAGELFRGKYDCYTADLDNAPCCLLNGNFPRHNGTAFLNGGIMDLLERERRFVFDHFGISLCAAVSSPYSGARGIAKACREAVEVMEYHYLTGGRDEIVDYAILPQSALDNREILRTLYEDKQLVDYIINEDYEGAYYFLSEIIEREFKEKKLLLREAVFRMTGLAYSIIMAVGSGRTALEPDLFNKINPITMIMESKSVEELKKNARLIFDAIGGYKQRGVKKQSAARVKAIEDYLLTHYHDPNMGVAELCQKFAISPSYFSRIFKGHTGLTLPEYLHNLRLAKAKDLLLNTSMSIGSIARETGFYNSRTFGRIFIKREGMTAGLYRERYRIAAPDVETRQK